MGRPVCDDCGARKVGVFVAGNGGGRTSHHPNIRVGWCCKNCFKLDFDVEKSQVKAHKDWGESPMPKRARKPESQEVLTGVMSDPPSTDSIGVTPDPEKPGEVPEKDRYLCGNCKAEVEKGAAACPVCELGLVWS